MASQGGFHVALVVWVSLQDLVLRDQTLGAFGQKHFMPKFHRGLYFSTFDEVGVRLKDGIDLLRIGNLLALEHTTARLIDHAVSKFAVVLNRFARRRDCQVVYHVLAARLPGSPEGLSGTRHDLVSNTDKGLIFTGLLALAGARRQALDFLHSPSRRPSPDRVSQPPDPAGHN